MWSYYGGKTTIAHLYPRPKHNLIIEPFAGSAKYALRYFEKDVLLIDKYEVVVRLWKWLQNCSVNDIISLPKIPHGKRISDYNFDCEEASWLTSFLHGCADSYPRAKPTARKTIDRPYTVQTRKKQIADNLWKIKHWNVILGDYEEIENREATWFIDPPYKKGGEIYKHGSVKIDYQKLAVWCEGRMGQTIVCENSQAEWMNFIPLVKTDIMTGKYSEGIWTNDDNFNKALVSQLKLF